MLYVKVPVVHPVLLHPAVQLQESGVIQLSPVGQDTEHGTEKVLWIQSVSIPDTRAPSEKIEQHY